MTQIFLAKQPILNRQGHLYAYELLFRSSDVNAAFVEHQMAASASVIHNAFGELGLQEVLGNALGFINVDEELLFSDLIQFLPAKNIVLEILETVPLTPEVITRVKALKTLGFRIALDDLVGYVEGLEALAPWLDIVKIDLKGLELNDLPALLNHLRRFNSLKLAEKVDSREQHEYCLKLGFDLFQGYYFAKPKLMSGRQMETSEMLLIRLVACCMNDSEAEEINDLFKQAPDLTVRLLRVVNSVGIGMCREIHSVREAITVLGRSHLARWLQLLLYVGHGDKQGPLLLLSATRGKAMEEFAQRLPDHHHQQADSAFMVGILSLLDALFDKPLVECIEPLHLAKEINLALLQQEGTLGHLLKLVIASELTPEHIAKEIQRWPELSPKDVLECITKASQWASSIQT